MKTKEQVKNEIDDCGTVFTVAEFEKIVSHGCITNYDGFGYFHDGEKETEYSVFSPNTKYEDIKDMPYVIWYNK